MVLKKVAFEKKIEEVEEIKNLPCFIERDCQINLLTGGESHRCFKVTLNHGDIEKNYFVKSLIGHQSTAMAEVDCNVLAAEIDLSPSIIYHSSLWLVSEFIEGESVASFSSVQADFSSTDEIMIAMNLMVKTHQLKATKNHQSLNITELFNELLTKLFTNLQTQRHFTQYQQVSLHKVIEEITSVLQAHDHLVLCHGDLNYENIRLSHAFDKNQLAKQAWLVDFECCCLAEAEFDIAMFIAINKLSMSDMDTVIQCYQQYSNSTLKIEKVRRYLACCYLINGFWYFKAAGESEGANDLLSKARQQFVLFDQLGLLKSNVDKLFK